MDHQHLTEGTPLRLRGQKCARCETLAFPPNPYGCEKCGAGPAELIEHPLSGRGRLHAFATTYHGNRKDIEVPYTVGTILLEDGLAIRAILTAPTDEGLKIGDPVVAALTSGSSDSDAHLRLQFQLAEAS